MKRLELRLKDFKKICIIRLNGGIGELDRAEQDNHYKAIIIRCFCGARERPEPVLTSKYEPAAACGSSRLRTALSAVSPRT